MAKKKKEPAQDGLHDIENALTRTEQFIEDNQKIITTVVAVIVLLVSAYLGYRRFIHTPRNQEAMAQMFMAERYFEADSFNLALYGDGNYLGFLDIIDDYGMTRAANLASYYSGISYLHLGQYEDALEYLKKFKSKDEMLGPISQGAIGDAYLELGETPEAIDQYLMAAHMKDNPFLSPIYLMKAGQLLEEEGDYEKALKLYREIETKYPESTEARDIEKFITRATLHLEK
ncbi:MAG TPA: tetratricopeptide repeat protein [Bacteroidetes bacterium]|nr:tetratricopeptide repeat protein [Bacteroidota bacterium]